jgi:ribosomal protein L5
MLVGCKVTLRMKNMFDFFENLILTLPRMEKFQHIYKRKLEKSRTNLFIISLVEIFLFYPLELGLGVNFEISKLNINFLFNTFLKEEKIFLALGNKLPVLGQ